MRFDVDRVLVNARQAEDEDLLDRVTIYRRGMEPEAVIIIEEELRRRGIGREQIAAHAGQYEGQEILVRDGSAVQCSFCRRPAVGQSWVWHRLWKILPIFPRLCWVCRIHQPAKELEDPNGE